MGVHFVFYCVVAGVWATSTACRCDSAYSDTKSSREDHGHVQGLERSGGAMGARKGARSATRLGFWWDKTFSEVHPGGDSRVVDDEKSDVGGSWSWSALFSGLRSQIWGGLALAFGSFGSLRKAYEPARGWAVLLAVCVQLSVAQAAGEHVLVPSRVRRDFTRFPGLNCSEITTSGVMNPVAGERLFVSSSVAVYPTLEVVRRITFDEVIVCADGDKLGDFVDTIANYRCDGGVGDWHCGENFGPFSDEEKKRIARSSECWSDYGAATIFHGGCAEGAATSCMCLVPNARANFSVLRVRGVSCDLRVEQTGTWAVERGVDVVTLKHVSPSGMVSVELRAECPEPLARYVMQRDGRINWDQLAKAVGYVDGACPVVWQDGRWRVNRVRFAVNSEGLNQWHVTMDWYGTPGIAGDRLNGLEFVRSLSRATIQYSMRGPSCSARPALVERAVDCSCRSAVVNWMHDVGAGWYAPVVKAECYDRDRSPMTLCRLRLSGVRDGIERHWQELVMPDASFTISLPLPADLEHIVVGGIGTVIPRKEQEDGYHASERGVGESPGFMLGSMSLSLDHWFDKIGGFMEKAGRALVVGVVVVVVVMNPWLMRGYGAVAIGAIVVWVWIGGAFARPEQIQMANLGIGAVFSAGVAPWGQVLFFFLVMKVFEYENRDMCCILPVFLLPTGLRFLCLIGLYIWWTWGNLESVLRSVEGSVLESYEVMRPQIAMRLWQLGLSGSPRDSLSKTCRRWRNGAWWRNRVRRHVSFGLDLRHWFRPRGLVTYVVGTPTSYTRPVSKERRKLVADLVGRIFYPHEFAWVEEELRLKPVDQLVNIWKCGKTVSGRDDGDLAWFRTWLARGKEAG